MYCYYRDLSLNPLESLPANAFAELTSLTTLYGWPKQASGLAGWQLKACDAVSSAIYRSKAATLALASGTFAGLSSLTSLYVRVDQGTTGVCLQPLVCPHCMLCAVGTALSTAPP